MPVQKFKGLSIRNNEIAKVQEVSTKPEEREVTDPGIGLQEIVGKLSEKRSSVPFNLKIIPRKKIIFNDKNDYSQVDLEKLAEGILHFGLIHSLEGFYDEEQDLYVIESGERRTRAIDLLLEKFRDYEDTDSQEYQDYLENVKGFEAGYPINVKKKKYMDAGDMSPLDEIDSEIRLMDANEEVRPTNPQDKYKRVTRRAELMERRNALLPYKKRINVNKEVGNKLGLTERQVQKYKSIDALIPELREEFFQNNITLADGANYSVLTEEEQRNILKLIQEGKKVSADDIKKLKQEKEAVQTELILKEGELSRLREESDQLRESHEKELMRLQESVEQERERIKHEISEEILNSSPDRNKVKELETQLQEKEAAQNDINKNLNEISQKLNSKNNEIERLEVELRQIKNQPGQNLERIRMEVKLSTAIETTMSSVTDIKKSFIAYGKLNGTDRSKFKEEIEEIVNNLHAILKI